MRNVFDQYDHWENRVTHSLMASLAEDTRLLRSFLREVACWEPKPGRHLWVEEQSLAGEANDEPTPKDPGKPAPARVAVKAPRANPKLPTPTGEPRIRVTPPPPEPKPAKAKPDPAPAPASELAASLGDGESRKRGRRRPPTASFPVQ